MTTKVYNWEMSSPRRYYLGTEQGIMQNKPNFLNNQMNVTYVKTNHYGNFHLLGRRKNKPKTKPKQTQFPKCQNEIKLIFNKGLRK